MKLSPCRYISVVTEGLFNSFVINVSSASSEELGEREKEREKPSVDLLPLVAHTSALISIISVLSDSTS